MSQIAKGMEVEYDLFRRVATGAMVHGVTIPQESLVEIAAEIKNVVAVAREAGFVGANVPDFTIEMDREEDGRWIADMPSLPGCTTYGATEEEARANCKSLAKKIVIDQIEEV